MPISNTSPNKKDLGQWSLSLFGKRNQNFMVTRIHLTYISRPFQTSSTNKSNPSWFYNQLLSVFLISSICQLQLGHLFSSSCISFWYFRFTLLFSSYNSNSRDIWPFPLSLLTSKTSFFPFSKTTTKYRILSSLQHPIFSDFPPCPRLFK